MSNKLLCVVGPTATGKTSLAVNLAKRFPSVLISADSRQVYRGMDIVTGKDHDSSMTLAGIDLLDPSEENSVSVWYDAVSPILESAWRQGMLPIVVGGTGLYVQALITGILTLHVKPDPVLRTELSRLSLSDLQSRLLTLAPKKFTSLNESDRANPRRLIRAIEVALAPKVDLSNAHVPDSVKIIGLRYTDLSAYREPIHQRVIARLQAGAVAETKRLLSASSAQSLSAIGYRSIVRFIRNEITEAELISVWIADELAYVKRQLTWFNKLKGVEWYSVPKFNHAQVASSVKAWYDESSKGDLYETAEN